MAIPILCFTSVVAVAIPQRPIIAVYHHVRRAFHPKKQQGKWMPEEDNLLKQCVTNDSSTITPHRSIAFRYTRAVTDLGQQWEKVSEVVGRMSSDCRDRYRNHIANREVRVTGPWSKEEEDELTKIVTEMTVNQGKDFDNDVFWGIVSEKMGNRRGRQQCRIKWWCRSSPGNPTHLSSSVGRIRSARRSRMKGRNRAGAHRTPTTWFTSGCLLVSHRITLRIL